MNPLLLAVTLGDKIDQAFHGFDLFVFSFFGHIQSDFMTIIAKIFTTFGDENFSIPLVILGIVLCFFKKSRKYGFALIIAIILGTVITNVIAKPMVLRLRPYNTLQNNADYWAWYIGAGQLSESDYSFPSGHTTAASEVCVAMFICFLKDNKKKIAWIFPVLAICVAGSRVYLMVHYATDVIGALLIGIVSGVLGYILACLVCKIKLLDKIDVGKLFKKTNSKFGIAAICIAVIGIFCYAFIPSLSEGGEQICAYDEEYNCYNAARVDDEKYPAIDGKEYCKIHWKQLSNVDK